MPGELKVFDPTIEWQKAWAKECATDNELLDIALAQFRQERGFNESIRLGDLPGSCVREVLNRAQELKATFTQDTPLNPKTAKDGAGAKDGKQRTSSGVPPSGEPSGRSRRDGLLTAPSPVRGVR